MSLRLTNLTFMAVVVCALLGAQAYACPQDEQALPGLSEEIPGHVSPPLMDRATARLWATGLNKFGQLGLGDSVVDRETFTKVPRPRRVRAVAGGRRHSLVVVPGGKIRATGWNAYGQLGLGDHINRYRFVRVPGLQNVVAVVATYEHSLALKRNGRLWATGRNGHGQLGLGDTTDRKKFTKVPRLKHVVAIAGGMGSDFESKQGHSIALTESGRVWVTGNNSHGQLGLGDSANRTRFTRVAELSHVVAIGVGRFYSVALTRNGKLWVTGCNRWGELGLGDTRDRLEFTKVPGLNNVVAVSAAAGGDHTLVLKKSGRVWATGYNRLFGQLGLGDNIDRKTFTRVPGLRNVSAIAAGVVHSVALKKSGRAWATGYNEFGQLGLGDKINRNRFTKVPRMTRVKAIAAGNFHSFLLRRK